MPTIFHLIDNNREFLHSDPQGVIKDYNLYKAIKNLKDYATSDLFDINSPEYLSLKDELEIAMLDEVDVMDNFSLIMETYLNLGVLVVTEPSELRYENLYKMFNYLVKTKYTLEYAARIATFRNMIDNGSKLVIDDLEKEKATEYTYYEQEFGYEFKLNTLQVLNLQATGIVEPEKLGSYVLALSDNNPLEKMMKNNLFNYQTFTNSELYFHTMLPDVDDLYLKVKSMESLMEASHYFWISMDNKYETFRNYIDFSYLENIVLYMIKYFKKHLDGLDSVSITTKKDPLSYYPSGQDEIFHVITVMRKILAILSIVYNLSKIFKDQYLTKKELDKYEQSLQDLLDKQITPDNIYNKMLPMSAEDVDRVLNGEGTSTENKFLEELFQDSARSYEYAPTVMDTIAEYVNVIQDTSRGYNSVVTDGTESGLFLDDISKKLIDIMETIISKIEGLRTILDYIKGNNLPYFQFIHTITWVLDLSFLYGLSQLIAAFNKLLYNFNCLLNALACFASYIKDMFDTLKTFYNDEDKFDLSKYVLGTFTAEFNGKAVTVTTDMLFNNNTEILSILSDTLADSELARVADALSYSVRNIKTSCISSWVEGLYQEALQSMKESIKAGQRCKITPGGRLKVDANLRFNLGIDIPDLRFQFRNCTGAS